MLDRRWLHPNTYWGNDIIGGKDEVAGGTWLGINKNGIVATILNRSNSLGFDKKKKRGNLVIDVLKNNNINEILNYLSNANPLIGNLLIYLLLIMKKRYGLKMITQKN